MAVDGYGAKNQPQFDGTKKSDTASDQNAIADYAALVGNVKVGPIAARNALTGDDVWDGLRWIDDPSGDESIYFAGPGWQDFPLLGQVYTAGMLTDGDGFTVIKQNYQFAGPRFLGLYFTVQATAALTVADDGNPVNTTVANAGVGFRPALATPLSSGSEGVLAAFVLNTNGTLRLTATGDARDGADNDIAIGDQFSGGGWFAIA